MAALTSVKASPMPAIARPAAVKMATPFVNEITRASFSLAKAVTAVATWPIKSTSFCRPGARASPIAIEVSLIADNAIRIEPPRPASMALAVRLATPLIESIPSRSPRTLSALPDKTLALVMPSNPNAFAIRDVRSATVMSFVASLISSRIWTRGFRLPAASVLLTLNNCFSSSPLAAEITPRRRRAVPASLPWMPTLPRAPKIETVSSRDIPRLLATGPAYFSDSPRPVTVLNVLFAA